MAEVVIVPDAEAGGVIAAARVARLVAIKPDAVLGLATGASPMTTWAALGCHGLDLSGVRGFALDEYIGLPAGHPASYRSVITRSVVEPLGLTPELVRVPGDDGRDVATAGARYEAAIVAAGGVDLQVLGIGRTGHIGFNEPGSSLASLTRVKTLTDQTRRDNARFFTSLDEDTPALPDPGARHDPARPRARPARLGFGEGGGAGCRGRRSGHRRAARLRHPAAS
jgi:glucosamine-6-phosphate deaminase